jgi:hypothetical protein
MRKGVEFFTELSLGQVQADQSARYWIKLLQSFFQQVPCSGSKACPATQANRAFLMELIFKQA